MSVSALIQLAPSGTSAPTGANLILSLEGKAIAVSPSMGSKPEAKSLSLFGFYDATTEVETPEGDMRSFDVHPASQKVLAASGRDIKGVKALLVITAKMMGDFSAMLDSPEMADNVGPMFGDKSGLIVKHFLGSRWGEKNIGGGCYFFESEADIEAYLSSEFWDKCVKETPWEGVEYEMYAVTATEKFD